MSLKYFRLDVATVLLLACGLLTVGCSSEADDSPDGGNASTADGAEATAPDTTSEPEDTGSEAPDAAADTGSERDTATADTGSPPEDTGSTPDDVGSDTEADAAPAPTYTFYKDVKPITDARCARCHVPGGIGPFPLETYEQIKAVGASVKSQVTQGIMPPYLAGDGCNTYQHDISLSDKQVKTISTWVDEGAPKGDPGNEGDPLPKVKDGMSRVDLNLKMPKAYKPQHSPDDYRCIPIKWPENKKKFVTGFGVEPDKDAIVHHVIAFMAPPRLSGRIQKKAAAEKGPGYTCYGGPGIGGFGLGDDSISWLGAWAPGTPDADFPADTGIPVEPGSTVILQVHYNTTTAKPVPDQTSIKMKLDDTVKKEAMYIPWANPAWLQNEKSMLIPAGASGVSHQFSFDLVTAANQFTNQNVNSIDIHDVFFHMHQLGESGRMWVGRRDGTDDCLLEVPKWDFDWQRGYRLKKPARLKAGDSLGIKCTWDNTPANQPVINGKKQKPVDVTWGEGTQDEMCLGVFYATIN